MCSSDLNGISYPPGVLFTQVVGYILIDPEEPPQISFNIYEEGVAQPPKERNWEKVQVPKGMHPYLYGVAIPRGLAPLQTAVLAISSVPIIYAPDPLTGLPKEIGQGAPIAFSTPIGLGPILAKIYDPLFPVSQASDSRNAYPLPGMDGGGAVPLAENSYLRVAASAPIVLSAAALKLKKPIRIAVTVAGWQKDPVTITVDDAGGWSTYDY